jgi:RNA polymerase sigma-70 factor, ECF subfamily
MHPLTSTFELVQLVHNGDRSALERLTERYYDRVRRIVRARIGSKLRQRLETTDILNEAFAKAIEIFDRFEMRDEGSLLRWLGQIAEGKVRDQVDKHKAKKRAVDREVASGGDDDGLPRHEAPDTARHRPDRVAQRNEEQERLEAALDQLKPEYREIILARDFEGLSWSDVARETGRPSEDAARMYYAKATTELTLLMQQANGDDKA